MKRYARPILAVLFVLMLATPALIRRFGGSTPGSSAPPGDADVRARYGFQLTVSS
jgi:hypothetical protein